MALPQDQRQRGTAASLTSAEAKFHYVMTRRDLEIPRLPALEIDISKQCLSEIDAVLQQTSVQNVQKCTEWIKLFVTPSRYRIGALGSYLIALSKVLDTTAEAGLVESYDSGRDSSLAKHTTLERDLPGEGSPALERGSAVEENFAGSNDSTPGMKFAVGKDTQQSATVPLPATAEAQPYHRSRFTLLLIVNDVLHAEKDHRRSHDEQSVFGEESAVFLVELVELAASQIPVANTTDERNLRALLNSWSINHYLRTEDIQSIQKRARLALLGRREPTRSKKWYDLPEYHGDLDAAWYQIPASYMLKPMIRHPDRPIHRSELAIKKLGGGRASDRACKILDEFFENIDIKYDPTAENPSGETEKHHISLDPMGQIIKRDKPTGVSEVVCNSYGWSPKFCQDMRTYGIPEQIKIAREMLTNEAPPQAEGRSRSSHNGQEPGSASRSDSRSPDYDLDGLDGRRYGNEGQDDKRECGSDRFNWNRHHHHCIDHEDNTKNNTYDKRDGDPPHLASRAYGEQRSGSGPQLNEASALTGIPANSTGNKPNDDSNDISQNTAHRQQPPSARQPHHPYPFPGPFPMQFPPGPLPPNLVPVPPPMLRGVMPSSNLNMTTLPNNPHPLANSYNGNVHQDKASNQPRAFLGESTADNGVRDNAQQAGASGQRAADDGVRGNAQQAGASGQRAADDGVRDNAQQAGASGQRAYRGNFQARGHRGRGGYRGSHSGQRNG